MSQELFDEAVHLEEIGQIDNALRIWRELASSSPTRNVLLRYGGAAKELGLQNEAEQAFKLALEKDERSVLALIQLGIISLARCDYEAAEGYCRRAGEIEPNPGSFSLLGVALRNLGRSLDAEEAYRTAIRLDSEYEEALFNLGVLLRNDRPAEAQALFRRALELDPDYGAAHRELGYLLRERDATTEAEEHLRKSIELEPNDAWAHIYLGTHIWGNDPDAAIEEFRLAREMCPQWTVPLVSLGTIHEFVLEDYDQAQWFFESALRLDPDDVVTLRNIGRLCKKRGAFSEARLYLDRALVLDPANQKVKDLLAEIAAGRSD